MPTEDVIRWAYPSPFRVESAAKELPATIPVLEFMRVAETMTPFGEVIVTGAPEGVVVAGCVFRVAV